MRRLIPVGLIVALGLVAAGCSGENPTSIKDAACRPGRGDPVTGAMVVRALAHRGVKVEPERDKGICSAEDVLLVLMGGGDNTTICELRQGDAYVHAVPTHWEALPAQGPDNKNILT